jgi:predicted alpha/beta superfamily hydrolase
MNCTTTTITTTVPITAKILLLLSFIFSLQINVLAQNNIVPKTEYLQQVGVADSVYSKSLDEYRKFYVQFPPNYNPTQNEKYPVVYILDGEVLLPTVHAVQSFYSGGFMPEMVLIGISNAENRLRDLTTSKIESMNGMPFNAENGDAANFITFIENELIPAVEKTYPVTPFRTLIGHSYGGLFTMYNLVHHPDLFNNYIAIDPSLDWDNQQLLTEAKAKFLGNTNYTNKSLFMSLNGQLHMQKAQMTLEEARTDSTDFTLFARANLSFSDYIKENTQNGLAYEWKQYPRELHGTIAFPSIMDGLISVFQWYQMEDVQKFNMPTSSVQELSQIINHRNEKLQRYFGYSVPPFPDYLLNVLGYMSMDMEQMDKAQMFFDFAIKFYPKSANVYDAQADYFERIGDTESALKSLAKAYELSNDDFFKQKIETLKKQ